MLFADSLILAFVRFRVGVGMIRLWDNGDVAFHGWTRFLGICGLGIVDACRNGSFAAFRLGVSVGREQLINGHFMRCAKNR